MTDTPTTPGDSGQQSPTPVQPSPGRRRWLQAGISATPVIMTVLSGPVLAASKQCLAPSAFASMNTSPGGQWATCQGLSHGYWKTHAPWPPPYAPGNLFDTVFTGGGYPGKTLLQVLELGGGGNNPLARDIVGALLNAAAGLNPPTVMTDAVIKDMWNQYITTGHWVSGSLDWDGDEIHTWLKSTFS